jgi:cytochrome c oxidase subunit III
MSAAASALTGGSTALATADPHAHSNNERLGITLFIVSEAMMFGAFFAQYFYNRILAPEWPIRNGLPEHFDRVPSFPLPLILTVLLVLSGFTAHNAQTAISKDNRDSFTGWLIVTILLGVGFLAGQGYEYYDLIFREGFTISTGLYGTLFFSLTGLHGLHVTAGVLLLIGVVVRGFMGHFSSRSHFGVEGTVLYWHFVDVVWIALYVAVYLF